LIWINTRAVAHDYRLYIARRTSLSFPEMHQQVGAPEANRDGRNHRAFDRRWGMLKVKSSIVLMSTVLALGSGAALGADPEVQKQLDDLKAAIPKFAIPMREVGDRFQDMNSAAKGGNWALAAYMSKYMNGAMTPARLTKPDEYKVWKSFYEDTFAATNKAIQAKDVKAFEAAYTAVVKDCNGCHAAMGYGFIKVVVQAAPSDIGIDYKVKSEPGDVPK
jgi:cytochrome c556